MRQLELLPGVHDVIEYDAPWVLFDPPPVRSQAVAELPVPSRLGVSTQHWC